MKFAPLHLYSGYSFLKSGLTLERIVSCVKKFDYFGASVTDQNVLYSLPRFIALMEKINKPFIPGMEITFEGNVICLYAYDEEGYLALSKISSEILKNDLSEATSSLLEENGNKLIAILDTNEGQIKEDFLSVEVDELTIAKKLLKLSKLFKDFYLGIEIKERSEINHANRVRQFAVKHTYETVAFPHIKYEKEDDAIALKIVEAIAHDEKLEEKKFKGNEHFFEEKALEKIYLPKELENTVKIIKSSTFDYHQKRGEMLHFPVENSKEFLHKACYDRLQELKLDNEAYKERLEKELRVISNMGYDDYFLLVQDYVLWAKKNDILVSLRGSAAGSLVAYLLGISNLDPIKYDLLFERFLNESRKTMPDIDMDFMDNRRGEVIEYCREKYGRERVANIITFQTILARQSLRDIGRIYNYPTSHIDRLSKALTNKNYDLRQSYKNLETFRSLVDSDPYFLEIVSLASKIEGLQRQSSLHAAGVILNNTPIEENMPVTIDLNDNLITQYEMNYLEEQGFLKMDFLGLNHLTVISDCVDLINKNHPEVKMDRFNVPYDDPKTYQTICSLLTMGIFQLESSGMKNAIKTLQPSSFDDVAALLALFRPGPMDFIPSYAKRKAGLEKIPEMDEKIKKILGPTYGIITYQEQITQLTVAMANMSLTEADNFRRAVSKKKSEILISLKDSFIKGALKNGYSEKAALSYFNRIERFANYGFNKSHSYGYALLSCQMAYLKAFYPLEFYSTILKNAASTSDTKFNEYVSEMKKLGIKMLPPNINKSEVNFIIKDDSILFPLSGIKGVNRLIAEAIVKERNNGEFTDFFDFIKRITPLNIQDSIITNLIDAGALDIFSSSRASLKASLLSAKQYAEITSPVNGQMSLSIQLEKPLLIQMNEEMIERLDLEYQSIGIMLSNNPLSLKRNALEKEGVITIGDALESNDDVSITIASIIRSKRVIHTRKGEPMAFVKMYDESEEMEMTIFPTLYKDVMFMMEKNNIVIVKGHFEKNKEDRSFIAEDIKLLED